MRKAEDKEKASNVEADKVKEVSLAVAGGRCRKRVWLKVLKKTGYYFHFIFKKKIDYSFAFQKVIHFSFS